MFAENAPLPPVAPVDPTTFAPLSEPLKLRLLISVPLIAPCGNSPVAMFNEYALGLARIAFIWSCERVMVVLMLPLPSTPFWLATLDELKNGRTLAPLFMSVAEERFGPRPIVLSCSVAVLLPGLSVTNPPPKAVPDPCPPNCDPLSVIGKLSVPAGAQSPSANAAVETVRKQRRSTTGFKNRMGKAPGRSSFVMRAQVCSHCKPNSKLCN